jgi:hypothetical protein
MGSEAGYLLTTPGEGGTYRTTFWVEILARKSRGEGGNSKATAGYTYDMNRFGGGVSRPVRERMYIYSLYPLDSSPVLPPHRTPLYLLYL